MSEVKLTAETRNEFGKGAARRIRRDNKVPVVLYGHGSQPLHLTLPGHDLLLALRTPNVLISLDIDGKSNELAIPKSVQRDPLKGFLEHVDLLIVKRGEKVVVEVQVVTTGDAVSGSLVQLEHNTLSVEAEATHIPTEFEISIEGAEIGTQIHASDISLPSGVVLQTAPETLIVNITAAPTAEQMEGAGEETEAPGEDEATEAAEAAPESE
jgi:large subunit ribosomal protein L25